MSEIHKCCAMVSSGSAWYPTRIACARKAKFERDGKHYCGIHDPVAKEAKRAETKARWDAEHKAKQEARDAPFKRLKELQGDIAALRDKLEKCEKDALRYQELRNKGMIVASNVGTGIAIPLYGDISDAEKLRLDAQIDRLIQQSKDSAQGEK